ncbi:hypothetical protein D3C80_1566920 [compost metagenome]
MCTLSANMRNGVPAVNIHSRQTVNGIDQADCICAAFGRMAGNDGNIGNIRCELHNYRRGRHFLDPGRLCLYEIRLLA